MAWRIGEILDIHEQIEWTRDAGFEGVGFHAAPGTPGGWEGVEPSTCDAEQRSRLRDEIAGFELREIHAPFEIYLLSPSLDEGLSKLAPILDFAGDVNATVLTVHGGLPPRDDAASVERWREAMLELNGRAAARGVVIGFEITAEFDQLKSWGLSNVGVTLDVGHMLAVDNGGPLEPFGSIGAAVRHIGDSLVHLHMHDVTGEGDHREIGTGKMDFDGILLGLKDIGYGRGMTLELDPAYVTPEGILRSRERLVRRARKLGVA